MVNPVIEWLSSWLLAFVVCGGVLDIFQPSFWQTRETQISAAFSGSKHPDRRPQDRCRVTQNCCFSPTLEVQGLKFRVYVAAPASKYRIRDRNGWRVNLKKQTTIVFFCQNSTSNMWWCLEFWSFGVPKNLRKSSSWENMSHLFSWASHLWNFCKFCQGPVPVVIQGPGTCAEKKWLGGGFKYLLFSPLVGPVGEMIQFD